MISFYCSEAAFQTERKTPGSGSFEIENSRIREFWDRKLPDPGVLDRKTSGSGSFEKMLHKK